MKINGLTAVCFDIETTGFSAWEDEFICAAALGPGNNFVNSSLNGVVIPSLKNVDLLVTYNGEGYHGGFDFPFLRSKCIQNNIDWSLAGVKHLDLCDLVEKYINTLSYGGFKKSDFKAPDLKKLAKENGIDYQNKGQCLEELKGLENPNWLDYERKAKEDNSLQKVYQLMFDPEKEEEYISGEKIPKLYERYQEETWEKTWGGNKSKIMEQIKDHNRRDVERLKKVAEAVVPVLPEWEVKRNIKGL